MHDYMLGDGGGLNSDGGLARGQQRPQQLQQQQQQQQQQQRRKLPAGKMGNDVGAPGVRGGFSSSRGRGQDGK